MPTFLQSQQNRIFASKCFDDLKSSTQALIHSFIFNNALMGSLTRRALYCFSNVHWFRKPIRPSELSLPNSRSKDALRMTEDCSISLLLKINEFFKYIVGDFKFFFPTFYTFLFVLFAKISDIVDGVFETQTRDAWLKLPNGCPECADCLLQFCVLN